MTAKVGSLNVDLTLESAAFQRGIDNATRQAHRLSQRMQSIGRGMMAGGTALSAAITLPFAALVRTAIPAAIESRQALAQVEAANRSMGAAAGFTTQQLQAQAEALMGVSNFDDDDILKSVTANLLTFGAVQGRVFEEAQRQVLNLSARMGTDLQSATMMVGRALNAPIAGMAALRRTGIQFTAAQERQIRGMVASNNIMGAQQVMLAELERQFGGAAAAQRRATPGQDLTQAWGEFQEVIGEIALRVLPPLTAALTGLLQRFNQLSPSMQTFAVGAAAVAAALGPVIGLLGGIVSIVARLIPLFVGWGASIAAAAAAAGGLLPLLAPLLPVIAGVAAAVGVAYLAWRNWESIAPVLQGLWDVVTATIGPPLQRMLSALGDLFDAVWNGIIGDAVRFAVARFREHWAAFSQAFGPVALGYLRAVGHVFGVVFDIIGGLIRVLAALLRGDLSGAWRAIRDTVVNVCTGIKNAFMSIVGPILDSLRRIGEGVETYLVRPLRRAAQWVDARVGEIEGSFRWLYDRVVGNSWIPDMVDEIGAHMRRLDQQMVQPARSAAQRTEQVFEALGEVLNRLFPEQAAANAYARDLELITRHAHRLGLSASQAQEALARLGREMLAESPGVDLSGADELELAELPDARSTIEELSDSYREPFARMVDATQELGRTINDVVANGLRGLVRGFGSLRDVGLSVLQAIGDSILQNLMAPLLGANGAGGIGGAIANAVSGLTGGARLGGLARAAKVPIPALPKFARGGSFTVGGAGGIDTNLVQFWASRGERVDIHPTGGGPDKSLGAPAGAPARVVVELSRDLVGFVTARSTEVAVEVVTQAAPQISKRAMAETFAELRRPRLGG